VGPQSSAELAAIRNFSNANELLVISQGSTAGTLAIANDAIFRFCPGDSLEGGAVAKSVNALGYQYLITVSRNDAGNLGLQRAVGQKFSSLGGTTDIMSPYAVDQTDFSALLSSLKAKIQAGISLHGASKVGVYLASFDECVQMFRQASADPVFSSVRWFGGDGVVLSSALVGDAQAAAFAAATQFFAPNFGLPASPHPDLERVVASIRSRTNIEPDAYALASYDAVWVIAQTIMGLSNPQPDFQDFLSAFNVESKYYYGLTGPLELNAAGDRSNGTFDYWGVVLENGVYQWKLVGKSF
jgi:branched-chain amino acid transport system substrate-binding protein